MNKFIVVILSSLIMSPVFINGWGLIHHLVEHTHVFCESQDDHTHASVSDCKSNCGDQFYNSLKNETHSNQQLEYQDLNQFCTSISTHNSSTFIKKNITESFHLFIFTQNYIEDIFHPPIC